MSIEERVRQAIADEFKAMGFGMTVTPDSHVARRLAAAALRAIADSEQR